MIALKRNQPQFFQEVKDIFEYIQKNNIHDGVDIWQDHDKGHGRIEDRSVISIDVSAYPVGALKKFSGLKSVVRVNSVVQRQGEQSQEYRYYITSQDGKRPQARRNYPGTLGDRKQPALCSGCCF